MTRQRIRLQYVMNNSARKACFNKRKKGFVKKLEELSTLCGVDAFAIIYGPFASEPEVWPPCPETLQRVLSRYKGLADLQKTKAMMNQESFNEKMIKKLKEQLKNQEMENRAMDVTGLMYQCLSGPRPPIICYADLIDMDVVIDRTLKEIRQRIQTLKTDGGDDEKGSNKTPERNFPTAKSS